MPKQRQQNPIQDAITTWIASVYPLVQKDPSWRDNLLKTAPKRFTIYEPMALLPAGSFTQPPWTSLLQTIDSHVRTTLWLLILSRLSKAAGSELTHLAVTEGIPLHREGDDAENILRSPSGLRMLCGDFGPSETAGGDPGEEDFERALWVSTKQNGIVQTWAPRWTMFSRGNVKEKARLLSFPSSSSSSSDSEQRRRWAVDLYAGIGYFVFCYASLGMRVLCWEINPWSVEGLRRGAAANRWSVRVVRGGEELALPLGDIMAGGEQIVVFLEDNQRALRRIRMLQESGLAGDVAHVNCGFLPTSEPTWRMAWEMTDRSSDDVWLHLHENVGVQNLESRRRDLQSMLEAWATASPGGDARSPNVTHIEQVKTFAPGVWHCVFDVHITRPQQK
ncbi:tRNA wybutosine-synthesizing protein-like protein [Hapsidospora chrysogenum ATCC 11550]|uniref:tRNA wybutosine-synthesizing protein 2 n=1 Tax=Hapsidospora chrysogenum (strain ATCC 11550 / CBS 779.69 / DSM 880 / IAM 14645 / JCM 23072 / IMI 49137) TaxID=857340 RepID=A0A086TBH9_HAPC1|nr:tRNA wybutosine-synthesizing protein-like protein [Hapsidospora chrysogenum ATCC 11550]